MPHLARIGAVAAVCGSIVLVVGTSLHPMNADPSDAAAAFAEYAADPWWIGSHLAQFLGVVLLCTALVALAGTMEPGIAAAWGELGRVGAAASLALAAALQAVDGVALNKVIARWSASSGEARAVAFESAFAVRQIEIGFASLTSITFGLTLIAIGAALIASTRYPNWLGWFGALGGIATVSAGVAQAYGGFSSLAMMISMSASVVLLVWALITAVLMWRLRQET